MKTSLTSHKAIRLAIPAVGSACAALLLLIGPAASAQSTPTQGGGPLPASTVTTTTTSSPATASEAYAVQLRAQFGFENDLSYVRTLASEATVDATSVNTTALGIPLTSAEVAELQRRDLVGAQIAGIDAAEAANPAYAGSWLDQAAGGVLNIAFVSPPPAAVLASLTAPLPAGTTVVVRPATVSAAHLNSLENQIGVEMSGWATKGVMIASSDVDLATNTTIIYVTSDLATARAQLEAAYGTAGLVVEAPAGPTTTQSTRDIRSGPVYGGEWINDGVYACTAGYANSHGNGINSNIFLITAGHCDSPGHAWVQGLGTSPGIGGGGSNGLYKNQSTTNCDCQTIGVLPGGKATTDVLVNGNGLFPYTRLATSSDFYNGRTVCVSGAHEYEAYGDILCGTITSTTASAPDDNNVTLVSAIETSVTSTLGGDSGAPWGSGGTYMGVHFGLINGYSSFSRSSNISAVTGTTPQF